MALQSHFLSSFTTTTTTTTTLFFRPTTLTIRSQQKPSSSLQDPTPNKPGVGFGSSNSNATAAAAAASSSSKRKQKKKGGGRERASTIIRRSPLEKPAFVSEQEKQEQGKEQSENERAFVLAWLGFGSIILVEGIALAASGFLPEEWDKIFVKYLYPSFTPTVFLFFAGAVAYGVLKYLQNEKITQQK